MNFNVHLQKQRQKRSRSEAGTFFEHINFKSFPNMEDAQTYAKNLCRTIKDPDKETVYIENGPKTVETWICKDERPCVLYAR
jgi:hypothetical protein